MIIVPTAKTPTPPKRIITPIFAGLDKILNNKINRIFGYLFYRKFIKDKTYRISDCFIN
jgi:hypothetical protein